MSRAYIPKSYKKSSGRINPAKKSSKSHILGILFGLCLIMGSGYALYSSILDIVSISVKSDNESLQKEVISRSEDFINNQDRWWYNNNNIFLTRIDLLEAYILQEFSQIKEVKITRTLNRTLNMELVLRTPLAKVCESGNCIIMSDDGIYMGNDVSIVSELKPEIMGISLKKQGERLVSPREAAWFKTIVKEYNAIDSIRVASIRIQQKSGDRIIDAHVYTEQGYYIMLDLDTDIVYQAKALNTVFINQLTAEQRNSLEYIDLRIKDRVYYKFKE